METIKDYIIELFDILLSHRISFNDYLTLAALMFIIGIVGIIINRKHLIVILMSIELMLLAININFITFSSMMHDIKGQIFSIFILTIAAAEAAIGLAIIVLVYRNMKTIDVEDINHLRG